MGFWNTKWEVNIKNPNLDWNHRIGKKQSSRTKPRPEIVKLTGRKFSI